MKERISPFLIVLAVGCFLAPIIGGFIPTDSTALDTNPILALLSGGTLPILQHTIIVLPFILVLGALFWRRKVLQMPGRTLGILFGAFFGLIVATFPPASFKGSAFPITLEWISYGAALYAVVGAVGRRSGPRIVLLATFFGCALTGLRGVVEYGQMKSIDPNWRIYGGWVNPNAFAAILLVGIILGIGLAMTEKGITQIVCALLIVPTCLALWFTGSRGALLALAPALVLFVTMVVAWTAKSRKGSTAAMVASVVVFAVAAICMLIPVTQSLAPVSDQTAVRFDAEKTGGGRIAKIGLSNDQSSYFRRLLWKGSGTLVREYPAGLGMGNYRYYSAKSGLTTQTQLAHEGFLQLAMEATVLAPAVLGVALIFWGFHVTRAPYGLPREQNILRATAVAAVISVLAHNLIDSDFYYFGIGLTCFVLIGVSLLLSADAVAPEFTPAAFRKVGVACVALLGLGLLYAGSIEMIKARMRFELSSRDAEGALGDAQTLMAVASFDAEAWDLAAKASPSAQEVNVRLLAASERGPSTRILRALARSQADQGEFGVAVSTLNTALKLDPNNLSTLSQLMKLQQASNEPESERVATRLINVENSLYFKVRSLPEIVPTETYAARVYLASVSPSPRRRIDLLLPAIAGYVEYSKRTVPALLSQGLPDFGGETIETATQKLKDGIEATKEVQRCAGIVGDRKDGSVAEEAEALLEKVLAKAAGSETK